MSQETPTGPRDRHVESTAPLSGYTPYFVSYSYKCAGHGSGFGCMEIGRRQTIQSFADVLSITELINETLEARHGLRDVSAVILNWAPFERPSPDKGREPVPDDAPESVVLRLVA